MGETPREPNSIGFLRLVFAGFVLFSHTYFLSKMRAEPLLVFSDGTMFFGLLGVQCFFVLSGYLVTRSFQNVGSVGRFAWHRLLRIAPAFWVCLIVTAAVFGPVIYLTSDVVTGYLDLEPGPLGYVLRNLGSPRRQILIGELLASNPWPRDLNGSLWTLSYEWACYAAVALAGVLGAFTRRRLLGAIALGLLLSIFVVGSAMPSSALASSTSRLFDTPGKLLCVHFAAGSLWALVPSDRRKAANHWAIGPCLLVVLVAAWHFGFHRATTPLILPALIFWLARHLPFHEWERRAGGDYSYGLYLYGYPVQQLLAHFGVYKAGLLAYGILGLAVALGLAALSWKLVEGPALSLKSAPFPKLLARSAGKAAEP